MRTEPAGNITATSANQKAFLEHSDRSATTAYILLGFLCASLVLAAAQVHAQTASNPQANSNITIVLPPKLMAGHPATLAVLGVDGKLAPGTAVDLGSGQSVTTDRTGRALFTVSAASNYLLAKASGAEAAALIDPAAGESEPQTSTLPTVISARDRFWICGAGLRGDADANSVKINGRPALVLAASPECLVALPGANALPGAASIALEAPGVHLNLITTLVSLDFESPAPPLRPGQEGHLTVLVRGSSQKLGLVVLNQTPGVIRFLRGDEQSIVTAGGDQNLVEIPAQAVTSGDFLFSARLVAPPDSAMAARYLLAADPLAPKDLRRKLSSLRQRLERHPHDYQKTKVDLSRIAAKTKAGDFRTLLNSALAQL
jgi:hypothetical protein